MKGFPLGAFVLLICCLCVYTSAVRQRATSTVMKDPDSGAVSTVVKTGNSLNIGTVTPGRKRRGNGEEYDYRYPSEQPIKEVENVNLNMNEVNERKRGGAYDPVQPVEEVENVNLNLNEVNGVPGGSLPGQGGGRGGGRPITLGGSPGQGGNQNANILEL